MIQPFGTAIFGGPAHESSSMVRYPHFKQRVLIKVLLMELIESFTWKGDSAGGERTREKEQISIHFAQLYETRQDEYFRCASWVW